MRWSWLDLMALPASHYGPLVDWLDEQTHGEASVDLDAMSDE